MRLLEEIKLRHGTSACPGGLSKNRGREITVTETLTVGPRMVLFSRPASTLSPRVIKRMLSIVGSLMGRKVAVIIMARRVKFTGGIDSEIVFVSRNMVIRSRSPERLFRGPGRREAGGFLSGMLWTLGGG